MEPSIKRLSRRVFAGSALAALAIAPRALAAPPLTGASPAGPFYPLTRPADTDADLTRVTGHAARARGSLIEVTGRVLDRRGNPLKGSRVELWQANAAGRYAHPGDDSPIPLDPDFQGFASLRTGADGEWRIITVKPGRYGSPGDQRPPHIHFDVRGRSHRLVAQMYFADEAEANASDSLYRALGAEAATALARREAEGRYRWDIVLMDG